MERTLTEAERGFVARAVRRRILFLALAVAGLVIAVGLVAYYAWRRLRDPSFPVGARAVIVLLILLNARQNLRQYRYARILEALPRGQAREWTR